MKWRQRTNIWSEDIKLRYVTRENTDMCNNFNEIFLETSVQIFKKVRDIWLVDEEDCWSETRNQLYLYMMLLLINHHETISESYNDVMNRYFNIFIWKNKEEEREMSTKHERKTLKKKSLMKVDDWFTKLSFAEKPLWKNLCFIISFLPWSSFHFQLIFWCETLFFCCCWHIFMFLIKACSDFTDRFKLIHLCELRIRETCEKSLSCQNMLFISLDCFKSLLLNLFFRQWISENCRSEKTCRRKSRTWWSYTLIKHNISNFMYIERHFSLNRSQMINERI